MPGPAPKQANERRRRNATIAMTRLPAEGRKGRAPAWPLIPDIVTTTKRDLAAAKVERLEYDRQEAEMDSKPVGFIERKLDAARETLAILDARLREQRKLEAKLWKDLWATPQAVQWERLGWTREVARYVRHTVLGELGELDEAKEARQWSDRLGLTPMSLLRLRWEIVADETAVKRAERSAEPSVPTAARRLRVVDPSAVAG